MFINKYSLRQALKIKIMLIIYFNDLRMLIFFLVRNIINTYNFLFNEFNFLTSLLRTHIKNLSLKISCPPTLA